MIDWRAITATSGVHAVLGCAFAAVFAPLPLWICMDCGGNWWFGNPKLAVAALSEPHVNVYAVEAIVRPIVTVASPLQIIPTPCAKSAPVDRLPRLIGPNASRAMDTGTLAACIHIDAAGRADAAHLIGRGARGDDTRLRRLLPTLTFTPAYRDGRAVGSWVMVQAIR